MFMILSFFCLIYYIPNINVLLFVSLVNSLVYLSRLGILVDVTANIYLYLVS
jgi:hypothetical protein